MSFGNLAPNQLFALPGGAGGISPDSIIVNGVPLPVLWAEINVAGAGSTQVVAAVASNKIRVVSVDFVCSAAVTVGWNSAGNVKRNPQSFAANSGMARDLAMPFYVETNAGEALNIVTVGAAVVRGAVGYALVVG